MSDADAGEHGNDGGMQAPGRAVPQGGPPGAITLGPSNLQLGVTILQVVGITVSCALITPTVVQASRTDLPTLAPK